MQKLSTESLDEYTKRVRVHGNILKDSSIFQSNLSTGAVIWVNNFTLDKTGYTLDQLCHMYLYDIVPPKWHSELSERLAGKRGKYFIFPFKTARNEITWWLCEDLYEEYPHHWTQGKYMTITGMEGHEFEVLTLVADTANKTGELLYYLDDSQKETQSNIHRLSISDTSIRKDLDTINRRLTNIGAAATNSANYSVETNQKLKEIENRFSSFQTDLTAEILSLLSSDKAYERRIADFNEKVNTRISTFEEEIKEASRLATKSIEIQASQVGKTLSKKITFPISVISGVIIIIAQLMEHPEIMAKIANWFSNIF